MFNNYPPGIGVLASSQDSTFSSIFLIDIPLDLDDTIPVLSYNLSNLSQ